MIKNLVQSAYAAADGIITNPVLNNSNSIRQNPSGYINNVVQAVISIFLVVAVLYFIWHFIMAAYHMISSQGNPDKWKTAQNALLHAATGIIIVFAIFAILKFVGNILGIANLKNLFLTWPTL